MSQFYSTEKWCIAKHKETNHMYDTYLPYEFHLRMADQVAAEFEHILDNTVDYFTGQREYDKSSETTETLREICRKAVWGHDLIEDTRTSYNDVKNQLGQGAADVIYAVTNEKGKTRKERANAKYYEGIRETKGGVFVKMCDRIANVRYSKMTQSRQFEMYKKENKDFMAQLGWGEDSQYFNAEVCMMYAPMFQYLINLFED